MPFVIATAALIMVPIIWFASTQRFVSMLDENINDALSRVDVQLSSQWDALCSLIDMVKSCSEHEYNNLLDIISARHPVTHGSTAQDVTEQESAISHALSKAMSIANDYPDLKANQTYLRALDIIHQYDDMVRQSRLIYNDNVTKLNRQLRSFPTCAVAGLLGFSKRDYLEALASVQKCRDQRGHDE